MIDDLDTIEWPEGIKLQQRNWIGRSEGVQFTMQELWGESAEPGELLYIDLWDSHLEPA